MTANRLGPCPCGGERAPGQGYCRECRARYSRERRATERSQLDRIEAKLDDVLKIVRTETSNTWQQ